jgi:hypothetical protein
MDSPGSSAQANRERERERDRPVEHPPPHTHRCATLIPSHKRIASPERPLPGWLPFRLMEMETQQKLSRASAEALRLELASGAHNDDVLQIAHLARSRNEMAHLRTAVERDLQRHERVEEAWRRERSELEVELEETRHKLQQALVASSAQIEAGSQDIYSLTEAGGLLGSDVERQGAHIAGLERDKRAMERDHAADTRHAPFPVVVYSVPCRWYKSGV